MDKLFVIGNGFDLSHGLKTTYKDFRDFIINKYGVNSRDYIFKDIEGSYNSENDTLEFEGEELATFIVKIIDEAELDVQYKNMGKITSSGNWQDFEKYLGEVDFNPFLDEVNILFDEDDDEELFRMPKRYEEASNNYYNAFIHVKRLFKEWINSIDTSHVIPKDDFLDLINDNCEFLTFNYTTLLEDIYEVDEVSYIHGNHITYEDIIMGHGNKYKTIEYTYPIVEENFHKLHSILEKDVDKCIQNHKGFFDSLKHITEIYSYGFSFAEVDLPYIDEICKNVNTKKVTWYLSDYSSPKEIEEFKMKVTKSGFKGYFDTFHIK